MSYLKPCPCGETPEKLFIEDIGQGQKWANVSGSCCGMWTTEFRTQYEAFDSENCRALAEEAWNDAPRASEEESNG